MDITKYLFDDCRVFEFEATCYDYKKDQVELEHAILAQFDVYDDEFDFKYDDGMSFLLVGQPPMSNVTNLNVFTNFNTLLELSSKFVNITFIYSFTVESDEIMLYVDIGIKVGKVISDKCISGFFNEELV